MGSSRPREAPYGRTIEPSRTHRQCCRVRVRRINPHETQPPRALERLAHVNRSVPHKLASAGAASSPETPIPSFCIILPLYNEAAEVVRCVEGIAAFLDTVLARTAIVAVDDGSKDASFPLLQDLQGRIKNLIVERHLQNGGYGAANRTGCRVAAEHGFEYGLVMDADGTQDPRFIERFFEPMRQGTDFIKATRYALGGSVEGVPWQRRLVSLVGNKLARRAMGVPLTDFTNGFRAIRTELWRRLSTTERNFAVLVEEVHLARKLGATFGEVPYVLTVRREPGSASKFVYSWPVYRTYLKYVFTR